MYRFITKYYKLALLKTNNSQHKNEDISADLLQTDTLSGPKIKSIQKHL